MQIDEVLTALQSPVRADLGRLLESYGGALTDEPTAAQDLQQLPQVQGLTGGQALNKAFEYGGEAGKYSAPFQFVTVASYMLANMLLTISRKTNTSSKDIQKEEAAALALKEAAAEVIAAQPKEMQQAAIGYVADYLHHTGRTPLSAQALADSMRQALSEREPRMAAHAAQHRPISAGI